ncbi:MAG TPA: SnoaL-like domain-containing protein, partial [Kofleriaceae bacterium]
AKSKKWAGDHEVHSANVEGPFPNGDKFAVIFKYDITRKADNQRLQMNEVALYYVNSDKIVREEFFYPTGP